MNARFYHISINVHDFEFYKRLLEYLGFRIVVEYKRGFGASDDASSIWVFQITKKYAVRGFHRKNIGLNHVAFRVANREDVDTFYKNYLLQHGIPVLYGGPAERPEYEKGYYAVYFEDPDRIKLEVVHKP